MRRLRTFLENYWPSIRLWRDLVCYIFGILINLWALAFVLMNPRPSSRPWPPWVEAVPPWLAMVLSSIAAVVMVVVVLWTAPYIEKYLKNIMIFLLKNVLKNDGPSIRFVLETAFYVVGMLVSFGCAIFILDWPRATIWKTAATSVGGLIFALIIAFCLVFYLQKQIESNNNAAGQGEKANEKSRPIETTAHNGKGQTDERD